MFAHDYSWKDGRPILHRTLKDPLNQGLCFKLISDPYHKHITVEKYKNGLYNSTVYDSKILDFRKLKPVDQTGWSQESIDQKVLIRDIDDRVVHIEHHEFEETFCRTCKIYSPQNWLASIHRLYYKKLGDLFNGVVLFDSNEKPVLVKKYAVNEKNEFTELKLEEWNMSRYKEVIRTKS